ncbi:hypothetical protein BG005_008510 [Podila minutissima]|nr:hypothetical protein BG005_008510 [Podila minutissima]
MISQDQGQKYLRWSRWAVLVLVLITSLLFSIFFYGAYDGIDFIYLLKLKHYPGDVAHEALLFIIAAVYGYALWGHKRLVPIYVRAFLVVGLAGGLFYVSLEFFGKMQSRAGFVLGCDTDDAYCHVLVSSDFTGAATGFLMLAEVALTLKFGPYISNATQQGALEQGKGPEANHHPAPILVSGQDQYQQQQQPAQLQQYQTIEVPKSAAAAAISFISFVTYIYAVCGASRVPTKVRTFLVLGLAYGLLFCSLSALFVVHEYEVYPYTNATFGCSYDNHYCHIWRAAQVLAAFTGFMMLLEVIMTGRLGPLDHNLRKRQYPQDGGYPGANVIIVRPDVPVQPPMAQVAVQPQVLIPMQQPYPYQHQQQMQPQYSYPQHEVIQHHPLPQLPQVAQPSTSA